MLSEERVRAVGEVISVPDSLESKEWWAILIQTPKPVVAKKLKSLVIHGGRKRLVRQDCFALVTKK